MKPSLLVVEDDPALSKIYGFLFPPHFETKFAESGGQALTALESRSYDAILLDYNLPDLGGKELLTQVRAKAPHAKILVNTGDLSSKNLPDLRKEGADDFVEKGGSEWFDAVLSKLKQLLASS